MLFSKLFMVMGLPWIFESLHYFWHGDHSNTDCGSSVELVWRIIGCINLLRGPLIFYIFICKPSMREKVSYAM